MKVVIKSRPTISELMESKAIMEKVLVNKSVYSKSETERVISAFLTLSIVEVVETGRDNPHFKVCNLNLVCEMLELNMRFKLVARYDTSGNLFKTLAKK
ncbi:hypothetical protein GMB50_11695 [Turicibacter sanguinis]|uniref:hypothetical protein n=1 Tax=Turicibacter sanguinis TaxID=154288 RepID=UPI0012BC043C|nr:hypothetical protein [Turicibacter sanguinis]MDB8566261.1 hypothetical protein [Turicibacter sanguinis]MDB8568875.1 hypothetical protein [Turicibacter sanguinis]MDB8571762.1 hypothetical protein [Turicibacter sanguinis]MDB8580383.1 hypothetical protein [Turicibacter sanguinis]MTO10649.1 hypothetical protein [Turicibacter sanguinis]